MKKIILFGIITIILNYSSSNDNDNTKQTLLNEFIVQPLNLEGYPMRMNKNIQRKFFPKQK